DCGTMRWRTANRFAAPMVVRMPGGFFKCGDPWHSQTNEVQFVHAIGWRVAMPSNAEVAVVTWGAMVERCEHAAAESAVDVELLDLRTLMPWDRAAVLASVRKTRRCLIVHEDNLTAGFGAEIAATLARDAFFDLDAPIERVTMPDVPSPHSPLLLDAVVPSVARIVQAIRTIASV